MTEAALSTRAADDCAAFKAATRAQWDKSASGWNAHAPQIRAWLEAATAGMLGMAGVGPGARVLDVAAGSGEQTLAIAQCVGPSGSVLATDLSATILALAQDNANRAGFTQVRTQVADGEDLQVEAASFDAAVCRLGLMFFPDPLRGLREMQRALRPGGGLCTMVFSQPERNPCITILMSTALKHAGLPTRDPYLPGGLLSLGRPGAIAELFEAVGLRDVATVKIFIRSSASPIQQILGHLDDAAADAAWVDMEQRLSVFNTPSGWEGPNELLLTAGRRAL